MKYLKIVLSVVVLLCICSAATLKKSSKAVYVFGVSASFTDTTIYYTEVQLLDSVSLDKNGFLPHRDSYSYQLKNYLEGEKGLSNRTCMIYFSEDKKTLDKEFVKITDRYKRDKSVSTLLVEPKLFSFKKQE